MHAKSGITMSIVFAVKDFGYGEWQYLRRSLIESMNLKQISCVSDRQEQDTKSGSKYVHGR